jgi:hypothetical protein
MQLTGLHGLPSVAQSGPKWPIIRPSERLFMWCDGAVRRCVCEARVHWATVGSAGQFVPPVKWRGKAGVRRNCNGLFILNNGHFPSALASFVGSSCPAGRCPGLICFGPDRGIGCVQRALGPATMSISYAAERARRDMIGARSSAR